MRANGGGGFCRPLVRPKGDEKLKKKFPSASVPTAPLRTKSRLLCTECASGRLAATGGSWRFVLEGLGEACVRLER